jgi:hypothetical protein
MKRLSAAMTVLVSLLLLSLASFILATFVPITEMFGAQGGEMVQLASSHVPTESDFIEYQAYQKDLKRQLRDLTGSD